MHSYATFVTHEASKPQTPLYHNPCQPNSGLSGLNSAAVQTYVNVDQDTRLNSLAPGCFRDCLDNCFVIDTNHDICLACQIDEVTDLDRVGNLVGDQDTTYTVTHQALSFGDCGACHANRARSQLSQRQGWALVILEMRTELGGTLGEEDCHLPEI